MLLFFVALIFILAIVSLTLIVRRSLLKASEGSRKALWLPGEKTYLDPTTNNRHEFSSITENASIYFSVIVPAYNEEERLSVMLDETLEHLKSRHQADSSITFEIIIVDDGSKDQTSKVALEYVAREGTDRVRLLRLAQNCGKGGAVKRGMLCGRGKYYLMVDADGATKFSDLDRLEAKLKEIEADGHGVAVGSRKVNQTEVKKSIFRHILTWGFHLFVEVMCVKGVRDTQCGFKLFTQYTAHLLFSNLHIERWAFDVELLMLAQKKDIPIAEVGVTWTEIAGSKIDPIQDSINMAMDIAKIRLLYLLRIWKFNESHHQA
eukprot:TRINITY_DN10206_c0_g1_i1.p1 TRINITY_DN10206_c0_g1~~TRINITY_DN10206_c0_g1_i1.p1  ORF type:complete len:335 (-),score=128.95 TRINITY_DN10206_c0_g1_i1:79-1038(-)